MDAKKLTAAVLEKMEKLDDLLDDSEFIEAIGCEPETYDDLRDVKLLLKVLMHIVNGKTVAQAFGAPGDWGYGTAIGDALASRG